jgi:colanic acid/amylovoran biosynthesis glycosyltransferase
MLCIVSDAEGLSENVLHEKTGWVVPKRQPNLLASKIETIYNSPQAALLKISKYASERVLQEYNLELQKKRFIQFYQS